jgi:hypothetical protein
LREVGKPERLLDLPDLRNGILVAVLASTSSRPMPPAAPVTIATRCCSLIISSCRFV